MDIGGEYILVFPQADDPVTSGYGWQLDKDSYRFITTNAQGQVRDPVTDRTDGRTLVSQDQDELAAAIDALSIQDATEEQRSTPTAANTYEGILTDFYSKPENRRDVYFSLYTSGKLGELTSLCRPICRRSFHWIR